MAENKQKNKFFQFNIKIFYILWCLIIIIHGPISGFHTLSTILSNFIYAPAVSLLILYLCQYETFLSHFFSSKLLMIMGEISYSVYLLQFWVLTFLSGSLVSQDYSFNSYLNSLIKILGILIFSTLFARGSYSLLEKPCRNFIRKILTLRQTKDMVNALPEVILYQSTPTK